ncbi:MAG: SMP-30/gluconolactonase/LRE family protein [Rikenellaceae bacterium]|nr:SMP-30/gluconolactonase/LRE family protein [Rikenellaceae bacterium]
MLKIKYISLLTCVLSMPISTFSQQVKDLLPEWTFTKGIEGPSFDKRGILYAVNFSDQGTIGAVDRSGKASLYVRLPEGSVGNGIRFDKLEYMYVADYQKHNILKINPRTREIVVFAHEPAMNQPNDIAISPITGIIYASDPNWKESTGKLWMVDRMGGVHLLEENMGTTNGIEVSPDGKTLYVNESVSRIIWRYDITLDGGIENKRQFIKFEDFGMDGMRCDKWGNLFVTRHGKGTVVILSPNGKLLKEIPMKGKLCSNIALKTRGNKVEAFVTMADRGCFEYFRINYKEYGKE